MTGAWIQEEAPQLASRKLFEMGKAKGSLCLNISDAPQELVTSKFWDASTHHQGEQNTLQDTVHQTLNTFSIIAFNTKMH